jgi:hypothetical protein
MPGRRLLVLKTRNARLPFLINSHTPSSLPAKLSPEIDAIIDYLEIRLDKEHALARGPVRWRWPQHTIGAVGSAFVGTSGDNMAQLRR